MNTLLSFFGKVGGAIWKGLKIAAPFAATAGSFLPGAGDTFAAIIALVGNAERIGEIVKAQGGTKLDKLKLVLPEAMEVIKRSEALAHHELVDETLFREGVTDIINGEVKVLKAFKEPQ